MLSYDELMKLYENERNLKIYYQDLVKKLRKSLGEEYEARKAAESELTTLKKQTENEVINDLLKNGLPGKWSTGSQTVWARPIDSLISLGQDLFREHFNGKRLELAC